MAYLEVLGCLGTALVELLGGEVDFNVVRGFEVHLEVELTLVLVNVKGLRGGGVEGAGTLRESIDLNRFFQVISIFRIFLAALETLRHMLDFRSSVSCKTYITFYTCLSILLATFNYRARGMCGPARLIIC